MRAACSRRSWINSPRVLRGEKVSAEMARDICARQGGNCILKTRADLPFEAGKGIELWAARVVSERIGPASGGKQDLLGQILGVA